MIDEQRDEQERIRHQVGVDEDAREGPAAREVEADQRIGAERARSTSDSNVVDERRR